MKQQIFFIGKVIPDMVFHLPMNIRMLSPRYLNAFATPMLCLCFAFATRPFSVSETACYCERYGLSLFSV
ncbi:MAG: hypothetical protein J5524_05460 [Bacteroidaceae bacterium]|nr:hypothetical protein [Bacteroidaceae bacterium]